MKNKGLLVGLLAVLLVGAWIGFRWWQSYAATIWKYLPENAFFVLQGTHLQDSVYQTRRGGFNLREVPLFNLAAQQTDLLRLLANDSVKLEKFLHNRQITYALQKTPTNRFTYLVYVPLEAFDDIAWLESPNSTRTHVTTHLYEGQKVFDLSNLKSEPLGSYTILNNILVLCASGNVLEDWVRFAQSPLSSTNRSRFEPIKQSGSDLSIFLDNTLLSEALQREANAQENAGLIYFLSMLPSVEGLHLDKLFSQKHPTFTSKGKKIKTEGYVDILNNQKAQTFKGGFYIPSNLAVMYRLSFDNTSSFTNRLKSRLNEISSDSINSSRSDLQSLINKSAFDTLYKFLDKELILCQLEPNNVLVKGQILLQQTTANRPLEEFIKRLSILLNKNNALPFAPFQGNNIYTINWYELPASLFGGLFKGFPRCYITFHKNYMVYANDQQVLKDYLIDLEYRRTYADSKAYNNFLKQEMRPSNFMMMLNVRKSKEYVGSSYLSFLFNNLNYDLTEKIPFEHLVFQAAYKNGRAYSTLTLARTNLTTNAKVLNKLFLQQEAPMDKPLCGPFTVRNYPSGLDKTLVVGADNKLINPFLTGEERVLAPLDGPIVDDIHSVDFLSIDRLQYVFATQNSLYVVDEDDKQRYMILPSIKIPSKNKIRSFQRLESGIEGSFRFLVIDTQGFLYLWNSPSQLPQVLNPSRPFEELLLPISEVEYQGKRHFLFTQSTGHIGLISDKGVIPPPYKLDLKSNISGPFFGILSPDKGISEILGSSKYGELYKISLDGKIQSKTQLFRTSPTSFFGARADATNRDWILLREAESQFAILDKNGKELFVAQELVPDQNQFQYHFLGADLKFLSIKSGKFTTLYNLQGKQIGDKPIPSDLPIRVTLIDGYNKLLIYTYSNGKFQTWSLKIR